MSEKFNQNEYIAAYNKANYSRIEMKVPKELKENWEHKAEAAGMSLTAWIRNAANDAHVMGHVLAAELGSHARDLKLVFNRDNSMFYRSLLHFCADNGILVISTNPATLSTVVRIKTK